MTKRKSDDIFYGFTLNEDQEKFKEALMDDNIQVVLCDAVAGAGKTLLAIACAKIKVLGDHKYDECTYIFPVVEESSIGFRPGDTSQKLADYLEPVYDALSAIGDQPTKVIANEVTRKNGTCWVDFRSPVFLRGCNLKKKFIIIDECQNLSVQLIKRIISRAHDDSKIVILGCQSQQDIPIGKSGFQQLIDHMEDYEGTYQKCTLSTSYRGKLAEHIDKL